jgi:hypothetical protein
MLYKFLCSNLLISAMSSSDSSSVSTGRGRVRGATGGRGGASRGGRTPAPPRVFVRPGQPPFRLDDGLPTPPRQTTVDDFFRSVSMRCDTGDEHVFMPPAVVPAVAKKAAAPCLLAPDSPVDLFNLGDAFEENYQGETQTVDETQFASDDEEDREKEEEEEEEEEVDPAGAHAATSAAPSVDLDEVGYGASRVAMISMYVAH